MLHPKLPKPRQGTPSPNDQLLTPERRRVSPFLKLDDDLFCHENDEEPVDHDELRNRKFRLEAQGLDGVAHSLLDLREQVEETSAEEHAACDKSALNGWSLNT